jgi:hypothetical protein
MFVPFLLWLRVWLCRARNFRSVCSRLFSSFCKKKLKNFFLGGYRQNSFVSEFYLHFYFIWFIRLTLVDFGALWHTRVKHYFTRWSGVNSMFDFVWLCLHESLWGDVIFNWKTISKVQNFTFIFILSYARHTIITRKLQTFDRQHTIFRQHFRSYCGVWEPLHFFAG